MPLCLSYRAFIAAATIAASLLWLSVICTIGTIEFYFPRPTDSYEERALVFLALIIGILGLGSFVIFRMIHGIRTCGYPPYIRSKAARIALGIHALANSLSTIVCSVVLGNFNTDFRLHLGDLTRSDVSLLAVMANVLLVGANFLFVIEQFTEPDVGFCPSTLSRNKRAEGTWSRFRGDSELVSVVVDDNEDDEPSLYDNWAIDPPTARKAGPTGYEYLDGTMDEVDLASEDTERLPL